MPTLALIDETSSYSLRSKLRAISVLRRIDNCQEVFHDQ